MRTNLLLLALILVLSYCKDSHKDEPIVKSGTNNHEIIIKGSDTELKMVRELAREYCREHSFVNITVTGGGSGVGFEALINGETEIATASREIKPHELDKAKANHVDPLGIMFSVDALAIVTNSKLGVDSLSIDQLAAIFSGEISNWKQVGGPDLSINVYGRDSSSGTYTYLHDKFMKKKYTSRMKHLDGNAAIVEAVQKDLGGIGYAGVGYLMDSNGKPNGNIWAMPLFIQGSQAWSPYQTEAVKRGDYVLARPLYQYINGLPDAEIYDFILFELTHKGQEIVRRHGYFPINDYQKEINKLNGIKE